MKEQGRQTGSITVFAVITMVLVLGFLLMLLEGARMNEMQRIARLRTEMSFESAFANYNSTLWETYHLLGFNLEDANCLIEEYASSGYNEYEYGINLCLLKLDEVEIEGYTLLTDGEGRAYIQAVSSYMRNNILYETAKLLYNQFQAIKNLIDSSKITGTEIDDALKSLEELDSQDTSKPENQNSGSRQTFGYGNSHGTAGVSEDSDRENAVGTSNILEESQRIQKTQLLELVVQDTTELSNAQFDLTQSVSQRELSKGKNSIIKETEWLDRVLLQQYLLTYLADYSNPQSNRGLSYELEYLIAGKDNDIENLRTVVNELLLIRETANFVYLLSDEEKVLEAELLATILAGVSANPGIIEVVKIALLLAWSFAESVLDVRALLQGKKVPLIKSRELWTLALENIGNLEEEYLLAKESEFGISYKTYLGILLLFQNDRSLTYRAMDVQEITMQRADSSLHMDEFVVHMQGTNTYLCAPVFASLKNIGGNRGWDYRISVTAEYGYN